MESGRIVVTGGRPTDDEVAAVTIALTRHRRPRRRPAAPAASRWIRAARLEAGGHPPIESPMRLPRAGWPG